MRTIATLLSLAALSLSIAFGGCATTSQLRTCSEQLDRCHSEVDALKKQLAEAQKAGDLAEKRLAAYRELAERLREAWGDDSLEIVLRNGRLVVQLPNRVLFASGEAVLKPEGKAGLERIAPVLASVDRSFLIAGHTDNQPVKADAKAYKDNWELSALRALTVVRFLAEKNVQPTKMGATGYGEHFPDADNATEEGRAQNRRMEIIVLPRLDEIPKLPEKL